MGFLLIVFSTMAARYDRAIALIRPRWSARLGRGGRLPCIAGHRQRAPGRADAARRPCADQFLPHRARPSCSMHSRAGLSARRARHHGAQDSADRFPGDGADWGRLRRQGWSGTRWTEQLGLARGALGGPAAGWLDVISTGRAPRRAWTICSSSGTVAVQVTAGRKPSTGSRLKARPVIGDDGGAHRRDARRRNRGEAGPGTHPHDAVPRQDLSRLPNRDRVANALVLSRTDEAMRATAPSPSTSTASERVNETVGLSVSDSVLFTLSRLGCRRRTRSTTFSKFAVLSQSLSAKREAIAHSLPRGARGPPALQGSRDRAPPLARPRALK